MPRVTRNGGPVRRVSHILLGLALNLVFQYRKGNGPGIPANFQCKDQILADIVEER